jgi:hypothetical protein
LAGAPFAGAPFAGAGAWPAGFPLAGLATGGAFGCGLTSAFGCGLGFGRAAACFRGVAFACAFLAPFFLLDLLDVAMGALLGEEPARKADAAAGGGTVLDFFLGQA